MLDHTFMYIIYINIQQYLIVSYRSSYHMCVLLFFILVFCAVFALPVVVCFFACVRKTKHDVATTAGLLDLGLGSAQASSRGPPTPGFEP